MKVKCGLGQSELIEETSLQKREEGLPLPGEVGTASKNRKKPWLGRTLCFVSWKAEGLTIPWQCREAYKTEQSCRHPQEAGHRHPCSRGSKNAKEKVSLSLALQPVSKTRQCGGPSLHSDWFSISSHGRELGVTVNLA